MLRRCDCARCGQAYFIERDAVAGDNGLCRFCEIKEADALAAGASPPQVVGAVGGTSPSAAYIRSLQDANSKLTADLAAARRKVNELSRLAGDVCAVNGDADQLQVAIRELARAIGYPGY